MVGRPSPLGNPFASKESKIALYKCLSPEESVDKFKKYIIQEIRSKNMDILGELIRLYKLSKCGDLYLGCWCVPFNECHAEFIKKILDNFHIITNMYPELLEYI